MPDSQLLEKPKKVISQKPSVVFNMLGKEIIYGFIAFLITYLFDLLFVAVSVDTYKWLIPFIDALEHAIMKALDDFDIEYSLEFTPFYKKTLDKGVEIGKKIINSFKKSDPVI